jgi:hypothetical protein
VILVDALLICFFNSVVVGSSRSIIFSWCPLRTFHPFETQTKMNGMRFEDLKFQIPRSTMPNGGQSNTKTPKQN